ncbi:MAG: peptidylprolyl isomerase [Planctomycetota bacterium]
MTPILRCVALAALATVAACGKTSTPTASGGEPAAAAVPVDTPAPSTPAPAAAAEAPPKPAEPVTVTAPPPPAGVKPVPAAFAAIDAFLAKNPVDTGARDWKFDLQLPPQQVFEPQYDYVWHLETSVGALHVRLFPDAAPMHVTSCVYLNKLGFYDGIVFHRIIRGFMAQGGCPAGTGRGGPGYKFAGDFRGTQKHDRPGLLCMANAGPNTEGSQFFLTFAATPWLDGKHTIWGELVGDDSFATLKELEKNGSSNGVPAQPPVIQKAWVAAQPK